MATRFPMATGIFRPLLLLFGATRVNGYVDVGEKNEVVEFRMGLYRSRVPRAEIRGARLRRWRPWEGIGWRTDLEGAVLLVSSGRELVEVSFERPLRGWISLGKHYDRIAVSVEDPDGLIAALGSGEEGAG